IQKLRQTEEKEVKDSAIRLAVKEAMKTMLPANSPYLSEGSSKIEMKELVSYKEAISKAKELDNALPRGVSWEARDSIHREQVKAQYKEAAKLADAFIAAGVPVNVPKLGESRSKYFKEAGIYGEELGTRLEVKEFPKIEMKAGEGLQVDTNKAHASWTYGSYYQSPVELNDIYGPVLVSQLNDQRVTWGRLQSVNFSGRSQIQFRARTGRNSTAGGYAEGAALTYASSFTGTIGRDKFQQPFSYYRVLVAVTGQEIAFSQAPGGMGDIWNDELNWSMQDLIRSLNLAVIGTGDGTSESTSLGFEGLILGTTGTLYGKNIATYTTLKSHKQNMSSAGISLPLLRKMIRFVQGGDPTNVQNSNANVSDLVFFTSPLQVDKIKGIYQNLQRIVPLSSRVGFEGVPEIDTVPIFADPHMNTDDLFLIDTAHTKKGINLGPVVEELPIPADAKAAQIKIYWNLYSDAPSNNYWAHTLSTADA
ncbi:hypothetical protein HY571_01820, partial [Candidatus Micrarchaeota archaeon]|nr:hypothetical protein [Candidatus Micrarchaeota archaeon]